MSNFMRIAYSTEIYAETMVIFDTTSYNCPAVYEYKASYQHPGQLRNDSEGRTVDDR